MSCDYVVATHTLKSVQLTSLGNQQYVLSYQKLMKSQCALLANISCIDPNALELNFLGARCTNVATKIHKLYRTVLICYLNFQTKLVIKFSFFY